MKKIVAIIPARANSRRLPNKNFIYIRDKMLIEYTIDAAIKSNIFDDIILSTDSVDYHDNLISKYNIKSPGIRPSELSGDSVSSEQVINYVLDWYERNISVTDYFYLLQPTSPGRDYLEILRSINFLKTKSLIGYSSDKISGATYIIRRADFDVNKKLAEIDHDKYYSNLGHKLIDIDYKEDLESFIKYNGL